MTIVTNERATSDSELAKMGIRRAIQGDVARIMEIRHSVLENRLSDPNLVTGKDCAEFIERSEMWVWEEDGIVQAFAAGDIRDGWIWALFVAPEYEGRGIGKALSFDGLRNTAKRRLCRCQPQYRCGYARRTVLHG